MPNNFTVSVTGDKELIAKFETMKNLVNSPKMNQALLDIAMVVEKRAKDNLTEMVYSVPESEQQKQYYPRTGGLMQKTMATGEVIKEGLYTLITAVKVSVFYASIVHWGLGFGRNLFPRPFLTKAAQDSKEDAIEILRKV